MTEKNNELNQVYSAIVDVGNHTIKITEEMAKKIREAIDTIISMRYEANRAVLSAKLSGTTITPSQEKAQELADSLLPLASTLEQIEKNLNQHNQQIKMQQRQSALLGQGNPDPILSAQMNQSLNNTISLVNNAREAQIELAKHTMLVETAKSDPAVLSQATKNIDSLIKDVNKHNHDLKVELKQKPKLEAEAEYKSPKMK